MELLERKGDEWVRSSCRAILLLHWTLEMRLIARKDEVDEELGNLKITLKT